VRRLRTRAGSRAASYPAAFGGFYPSTVYLFGGLSDTRLLGFCYPASYPCGFSVSCGFYPASASPSTRLLRGFYGFFAASTELTCYPYPCRFARLLRGFTFYAASATRAASTRLLPGFSEDTAAFCYPASPSRLHLLGFTFSASTASRLLLPVPGGVDGFGGFYLLCGFYCYPYGFAAASRRLLGILRLHLLGFLLPGFYLLPGFGVIPGFSEASATCYLLPATCYPASRRLLRGFGVFRSATRLRRLRAQVWAQAWAQVWARLLGGFSASGAGMGAASATCYLLPGGFGRLRGFYPASLLLPVPDTCAIPGGFSALECYPASSRLLCAILGGFAALDGFGVFRRLWQCFGGYGGFAASATRLLLLPGFGGFGFGFCYPAGSGSGSGSASTAASERFGGLSAGSREFSHTRLDSFAGYYL
jgi:hypothetical protein